MVNISCHFLQVLPAWVWGVPRIYTLWDSKFPWDLPSRTLTSRNLSLLLGFTFPLQWVSACLASSPITHRTPRIPECVWSWFVTTQNLWRKFLPRLDAGTVELYSHWNGRNGEIISFYSTEDKRNGQGEARILFSSVCISAPGTVSV